MARAANKAARDRDLAARAAKTGVTPAIQRFRDLVRDEMERSPSLGYRAAHELASKRWFAAHKAYLADIAKDQKRRASPKATAAKPPAPSASRSADRSDADAARQRKLIAELEWGAAVGHEFRAAGISVDNRYGAWLLGICRGGGNRPDPANVPKLWEQHLRLSGLKFDAAVLGMMERHGLSKAEATAAVCKRDPALQAEYVRDYNALAAIRRAAAARLAANH